MRQDEGRKEEEEDERQERKKREWGGTAGIGDMKGDRKRKENRKDEE